MSHDIKNNSDKRRGRKNSSSNGLQELVENEKRTRVFAIGVRKDVEAFIEYIKKEEPNLYRDSIIEKEQQHHVNNNNSSSMTATIGTTNSIIPLERVIGEINFKYSTRGVKVFKLMYSCKDIIGDLLLCTHKDPYYDIAAVSQSSKASQASLLSTRSRSNSKNGNDNNSSFPFSSSHGSPSLNNNNNANGVELKQVLSEVLKAQNEVHIQSFQQLLKQQNELYAETIKNLLQQVTSMSIGMNSRNESNQHSSFPLLSQHLQLQQQQSKNKQVMVVGGEENDQNSNQKQQHNQDSKAQIDNNSTTIFKRINEMIADEGIFEYTDLRKALQKEGFQDQGIFNVFVNHRIQIDNLRDIFRQYTYQQPQQQQQQQQYPSFICQQRQSQQRQSQQGYGQQLLSTKEQVMIEIEDNNISTVDTAVHSHKQEQQLTSQPTQQTLSVQVEMQQILNNEQQQQQSMQQSQQQQQQQPTNKSEQNHYDRLKQGRIIRENNKSPFKDIVVSRSPSPINRKQQPFN